MSRRLDLPIRRFLKDNPVIARALEEQNWTVELTQKCHLKFVSPNGDVVFASGTSSDARSRPRIISDLRKHGLNLERGLKSS